MSKKINYGKTRVLALLYISSSLAQWLAHSPIERAFGVRHPDSRCSIVYQPLTRFKWAPSLSLRARGQTLLAAPLNT